MIKLDEAFAIIKNEVRRLPSISAALLNAAGCELREEIVSPMDVPPFACSAMDGFAVRIADFQGDGPWRLPIQKIIAAGDSEMDSLRKGHAAKIMTGAPMPEGADAVVKVEDVTFDSGHMTVDKIPTMGNYIRPAGNDIRKGNILYKTGDQLDAVAIGVLASIGKSEVKITPKPKITVLSTGQELANPGQEISGGKIYNSNDFVLKSLLKRDGLDISPELSTSVDDVEILIDTLTKNIAEYDLVITSGGVSMGDLDLIPEAVKRIGGRILFHKVFVKPGKPVLLANIDGKWLLALPGNPVSVFVGYRLYAKRIIGGLSGLEYEPRRGKAILETDMMARGDRFNYIGAQFEKIDGVIKAYPSARQESGRLSSITGINGFISIEGGTRTVPKGTEVNIEWL